ncbi:MAG: hypothetical protein ACRC8C_00020 [Mycoplasmoidaceae bacterium]
MLPQFINQVNINEYYEIINFSPIDDKPTSIRITPDSFKTKNITWKISFEYKLLNAI